MANAQVADAVGGGPGVRDGTALSAHRKITIAQDETVHNLGVITPPDSAGGVCRATEIGRDTERPR